MPKIPFHFPRLGLWTLSLILGVSFGFSGASASDSVRMGDQYLSGSGHKVSEPDLRHAWVVLVRGNHWQWIRGVPQYLGQTPMSLLLERCEWRAGQDSIATCQTMNKTALAVVELPQLLGLAKMHAQSDEFHEGNFFRFIPQDFKSWIVSLGVSGYAVAAIHLLISDMRSRPTSNISAARRFFRQEYNPEEIGRRPGIENESQRVRKFSGKFRSRAGMAILGLAALGIGKAIKDQDDRVRELELRRRQEAYISINQIFERRRLANPHSSEFASAEKLSLAHQASFEFVREAFEISLHQLSSQ